MMKFGDRAAHLYAGRLGKLIFFARRFGFRELFRKPFRILFAPVIIPRLPMEPFDFQGIRLQPFYHRRNTTWACERCVEIPLAMHFLKQYPPERVLEVGNVLSGYFSLAHEVIDKFDHTSSVTRGDVVTFSTDSSYDLILSISTFEHIGFDDARADSAEMIPAAIRNCRRFLRDAGQLLLTVPIGYNKHLDELIRGGRWGCSREAYMRRTGMSRWVTSSKMDALSRAYGRPYPYANAIGVFFFGPERPSPPSGKRGETGMP